MIEKVVEGIYKIKVPLPIPVVGSMNCFVLTDNERSLVIDPGMDHEMCLQAVRIGLAELGVNLEKTDFFITHHHLDHFGLIGRLMKKGSMIYASGAEALSVEKIASRAILPILARLLRAMGFPEEDPEEVLPELLGDEYRLVNQWPFCCLEDGAVIERGGRRFRCIVAPGHSPGHMCLHQADSSLLIAGDVFSPVLQFFSGAGNPLRDQLDSFAELRSLEPRVVLPGHGEAIANAAETTERLEAHFRDRSESITNALRGGSLDAYQTASRVAPGARNPEEWATLPTILKFLAARDCFAHLLQLEAEGLLKKETHAERMVYSLCDKRRRVGC